MDIDYSYYYGNDYNPWLRITDINSDIYLKLFIIKNFKNNFKAFKKKYIIYSLKGILDYDTIEKIYSEYNNITNIESYNNCILKNIKRYFNMKYYKLFNIFYLL